MSANHTFPQEPLSDRSTDINVRLIEYMNTKEGIQWVKMEDICDDFKQQHAPPEGALLPANQGAISRNPGKASRRPNSPREGEIN